jgi:hypothetical protein
MKYQSRGINLAQIDYINPNTVIINNTDAPAVMFGEIISAGFLLSANPYNRQKTVT